MASMPLGAGLESVAPRRFGFGAFFRECWRKMKLMRADFELSESSHTTRSSERSAERLRDDEAWSRSQ